MGSHVLGRRFSFWRGVLTAKQTGFDSKIMSFFQLKS